MSLVWDSKPAVQGAPVNWVELKTSADIRSDRDLDNFERKLMKYWIQSFLLGVPKIIVGFRSRDGVLVKIQELETHAIPQTIQKRGRAGWDGNACINFASAFLDCESHPQSGQEARWIVDLLYRAEADHQRRRSLADKKKSPVPTYRSFQGGGSWAREHHPGGISELAYQAVAKPSTASPGVSRKPV